MALYKKKIDKLSNLKDKPIFILSQSQDNIIPPIFQYAEKGFYDFFEAKVNFKSLDYTHALPTIHDKCNVGYNM